MCNLKSIFLFLLLIPGSVYCQNPNPGIEVAKMEFKAKQVIPPAPEAAELGKYGNVPVSLFTGTPNISIPIFELKGNSLSLPISLSYNASGFKPSDAATWVGSGWSLNAGGVITRSAMGNPDKDNNYFGVANVLDPPPYENMFDQYTYMKNIQDGTIETQPDVYYYNFAGHSGKFVLKPDYTVVKKDKNLDIITPCISDNCYESKFTIVDEQGITYVFDQVETTTTIPNDDAGQPSNIRYDFVSSWYLSKMYSAAGDDVILFEYQSTETPHILYQNMLPNKSISFTYGVKSQNYYSCSEPFTDLISSNFVPPTTSIQRKYLSKIILKKSTETTAYIELFSEPGQREDSEYSGDRKLNQIKVHSVIGGQAKLVKQYDLNYSYFGNQGGPSGQKRLRLDNIQQIPTDENMLPPPPHTFTYNDGMAERFTASLDHWGYYNASGNTGLIPDEFFAARIIFARPFVERTFGDGANREPSLEGSVATLLNKIQYPTGGYTTFEYELNKAKFEDNSIHDVGGVRLKQIIDYSYLDNKATVKNYEYTLEDGTTSGTAGKFPIYAKATTFLHYTEPYDQGCCVTVTTQCGDGSCCSQRRQHDEYTLHTISLSANSIFSLGSFQGSPIGYSRVVESQIDLTNNVPLGKTVFNYKTGWFLEHDDDITSGDLIKKSVYRNDGKLLMEEAFTYQQSVQYNLVAQTVKAKEFQTNKTHYCSTSSNGYINYFGWQTPPPTCIQTRIYGTQLFLENYSIISQNKQLVQQTQKLYDQVSDKYLTTTKNFTYSNVAHNYPTLIEDITTGGEKIKTAIKYAIDYEGPFSSVNETFANNIAVLQQKNMMGLPIEKLQYRENLDGTRKTYLSGQLTDYLFGKPWHIYFLEAKPLLTDIVQSTINSGELSYDNHYRLAASYSYDHLLNVNGQSKTDDVITSYVWDYDFTYPVAAITGALHTQVAYTSFETNSEGGFDLGGGQTSLSGSVPTGNKCYKLTGNPIHASTNPLAKYIVSFWLFNNSQPCIVSGSTSEKIGPTRDRWTYHEYVLEGENTVTISGDGYIDELRLYPIHAQMTTVTYDPLIGITSQANANSQITKFEYDGLARLVHVRDADRNIIKSYAYNYGLGDAPVISEQTLFYNNELLQDFVKQGCAEGTHPDTITYKVPYGKYASVNQLDANAKAEAEIAANGQNYANTTGQCWYYSQAQATSFQKQGCLPELGLGPGMLYVYNVPAGSFKSTESIAAANALAVAHMNANGQAYINSIGMCECEAEGQRYINGTCEVQQPICIGSDEFAQVGGTHHGLYKCYYKYLFSDGHESGPYIKYEATRCAISQ
jgi:YD repeat-containing protein